MQLLSPSRSRTHWNRRRDRSGPPGQPNRHPVLCISTTSPTASSHSRDLSEAGVASTSGCAHGRSGLASHWSLGRPILTFLSLQPSEHDLDPMTPPQHIPMPCCPQGYTRRMCNPLCPCAPVTKAQGTGSGSSANLASSASPTPVPAPMGLCVVAKAYTSTGICAPYSCVGLLWAAFGSQQCLPSLM